MEVLYNLRVLLELTKYGNDFNDIGVKRICLKIYLSLGQFSYTSTYKQGD